MNHSVLGIHIQGNENLSIDTKGQVVEKDRVEVHPVVTRIRHDLQTGTLSKKEIELQFSGNCWLCEGWSMVEFKFDPRLEID